MIRLQNREPHSHTSAQSASLALFRSLLFTSFFRSFALIYSRMYARARTHTHNQAHSYGMRKKVFYYSLYSCLLSYIYSWYVQQFVIFLLHSWVYVYFFWLDTLNIRNKKDANKYKSENVWSARIVARRRARATESESTTQRKNGKITTQLRRKKKAPKSKRNRRWRGRGSVGVEAEKKSK